MKSFAIAAMVAGLSFGAHAADERAAAAVVKKYSEAVACQIADKTSQKNQYKAVKVFSAGKDMGGVGDTFVVFWEGDIGCYGGNGSVTSNFTVVEQRGFSSVDPVVVTDVAFPELDLIQMTAFSGKDGLLQISGLAFGPKDQSAPTKKVNYTLKLDPEKGFVKR